MMKRYSLVFCALVVTYFCIAGATQAQVPVTLKLVSPGSNISNNFYVGPYTLQVNGGGNISVVCDDFGTETTVNEVWKANALSWAQVSQAEFYSTAGLKGYEAVASLTQKMNANLSDTELVADIHFAIWAIFTPSAKNNAGFDADALQLYNAALAPTYNVSDFSFITIYDPAPGYTAQEFMGTPEPASMMLFGTGLLAIGAAIRHRPRRRASV
jgi:hypothetical protein